MHHYILLMKASDLIADFLRQKNVPCVFEVVGGMITHIVDSLYAIRLPVVSMHHEQAAAFAAGAVGRMTGIPGVAMATSGPGATNLLTGIGDCYFDSVPAVFITGQVNRRELKGDHPIRQSGFQETDIVAIAGPITKAAWQIREPGDLLPSLERAFALATEGRPGPVLLDIPMDIQSSDLPPPVPTPIPTRVSALPIDLHPLQQALSSSMRPLLVVGNGVRAAGAADALKAFAERTGIPVVHSLLGLDVLPSSHPLSIGMIGTYGNRWANLAVGQSDCIIVIGSRLDIRQTGADTVAWKGKRIIFHVDCDATAINERIRGCLPIIADASAFLTQALALFPEGQSGTYDSWLTEIRALRTQWPDTGELTNVRGIHPNAFMHALSARSGAAAAFAVDVGQHQMWAAQSIERKPGQRFLTAGGMGAMGFALPTAIGVAFIAHAPVVAIAGDGAFQLNIQELETVAHHHLPIKMIIIDNRSYGMVRQFQESYFEGRYQSTVWGYSAPDFSKVASAYGIAARTIAKPEEVTTALEWLWQDPKEPCLLQVMIDQSLNAYPKIAFGRPMTEMEPHVKPIDLGERK